MIDGLPQAIQFLCKNFEFDTLLDLGCGEGLYHKMFPESTEITGVDLFDRLKSKDMKNVSYVNTNIFDFKSDKKFDCLFSSHVIEHIPDTEYFLRHIFSYIKEDGVFCICYPPPKHNIVGGHVHLFNHGLVAYHLVRIGIDCSECKVVKSGNYNFAIMGKYKTFDVPKLTYNKNELLNLQEWFPFPVSHGFNGMSPEGLIRI